jgi:hypothetical protein
MLKEEKVDCQINSLGLIHYLKAKENVEGCI